MLRRTFYKLKYIFVLETWFIYNIYSMRLDLDVIVGQRGNDQSQNKKNNIEFVVVVKTRHIPIVYMCVYMRVCERSVEEGRAR